MRSARWVVIALLAVSSAGCGLFNSPEKQRVAAEAALDRGDYGEAAVTLRNLLADDTDDPGLRVLLARALFMQGDFDAAHRTLQVAAERGAEDQVIARLQAEWNLQQGNFQQVLDSTEDSAALIPEDERRYYRARALQGLLRAPEAMQIYRELVAANAESADLHLRMAQGHAYLGRTDAAQAAADRALQLAERDASRPVRAEAWMLKGAMAADAGDRAALSDAYRQAAAAAPGELNAFRHGQLLLGAMDDALQAADLDAARDYQAQLAKAMPQSPLARMTAARLGLFGANAADAIAELQRLLQELPNDAGLRAVLASGLLLAGSFEQALSEVNTLAASGSAEMKQVQDLVRAASASPAGSVDRVTAVAAALMAMQQPAMARVALDRVAGDHAADGVFQKARVQTELLNGRAGEALRLASEYEVQHPDSVDGPLLLAQAQVAARDHAAAAATYASLWSRSPNAVLAMAYAQSMRRAGMPDPEKPLREWLERQPRDHAVRITVASALQRAGQHAAAAADLQRALAGLPEGHPLRPVALNNLANVYAQTNDRRALETARQAYQLGGSLPAIQDTYGWLLVTAGRADEGLPLLQSAARASPKEPDIRYHYAAALAATGDRVTAAAYLTDLLENDSDFESRAEAERLHASL